MRDCPHTPLFCLHGHMYDKNKRPVSHQQAKTDPGI